MLAGFTPWPEEQAQRYREEGYWQDVTIGGLLTTWADAHGDAVAVTAGDRRVSYRELDGWAHRLAGGLRRLGIAPGDTVLLQLPNVVEFLPVFFALCRIGALPVLALPAHREHEIGALAELTGASAYVIADQDLGFDYRELARQVRRRAPGLQHVVVAGDAAEFVPLASLDAPEGAGGDAGVAAGADGSGPAPARPDAEDVAFFLLSGGTTGQPKLIPRTHADYAYNVRASAEVCELGRDTVYLAALPVAHNFALGCPGVLGTLHAGGRIVLTTDASPDTAFALIEREGVTVTALVPPLALLWMQAVEWLDDDLATLELLQVGGAKLPAEAARRVRGTLGCTLQQVFGMGEGLLNYTRLDDPDELVATTQGRPLSPADELRAVDEQGREVAPGEAGQLLTRGPYTLRGYYRAGEHNATAFTPDGFYRTGDLVRLLPNGYVVALGRTKEVINKGGEKVAAEELENELLAHPAVREVAVVPVPDPDFGERICAFVVAPGVGLGLAEAVDFLVERGLATYKLPDRLVVVAALPLTTVGKVNKRALTDRLAAEAVG
ncbi:AMP-binding protein [Kitasatospora sp. CM 4170]|uniref:(2,3-dihydroxybenzoyl)adenylate synthase n=1 Tax=Kitasatospora aburaviensis TaxID=67265 RepID=A0ABW1F5P8_9ACTN|nr:AMP-binding protein [Kitasatospora sp. CM 4170]WNM49227.1 AMP-binding protein [Kitasatospora sp. CM 4170]